MKTYKQYLNESSEQIDYDNDSFEKIWNYENKNLDGELHLPFTKGKYGKFITPSKNSIFYLTNGSFHRIDGPAHIDKKTESLYWQIYGELHREDGPAIINPKIKEWWYNGELHREDGPAVIPRGIDIKSNPQFAEWYINGEELDGSIDVPEKMQKTMINYHPRNIILIPNPTRNIQEEIIVNYPEYIKDLKTISPELKQKYSDIIAGEDLGI